MATTPNINWGAGNQNLPHPTAYSELEDYRASAHVMADGSVNFQYMSTTRKRVFVLTWTNITTAAKGDIETAIQAIVDDSDGHVTFTAPTGSSYTVERDSEETGSLFSAVSASGTLYWSGSLTLREV